MRVFALLPFVTLAIAAAPPATKPASAPTRVRDGLVNGSVRFLVPTAWDVTDRPKGGMEVYYSLPDGKGVVSMMVTQQAQLIPQNNPAVRKQLTDFFMGKIAEDIKQRKAEFVEQPKVERDDRFMLKVHVRYKEGENVFDAMHCYRGVGLNLVSVRSATTSQDKTDIQSIHDAGAMMLMSVNLGPPDPKIPRPVNLE